MNGPAFESFDNTKEYFIEGKFYSEKEFLKIKNIITMNAK